MGMKKPSKKGMTIDELAAMVAKGFDEVHQDISNLKSSSEDRFSKLEEGQAKIRGDISALGDRYVSKFEFDRLLMRFLKLEEKVNKPRK